MLANGERPTSNESDGSDLKLGQLDLENNGKPLKDDLLNSYMQQNEGLRAENAQLHQQRERLIHDHELVCRENDRLRKRLSISDLEDGFMDSDNELGGGKNAPKNQQSKRATFASTKKPSPERKNEKAGKNKQMINQKEETSKAPMANGVDKKSSNLTSGLEKINKTKDSKEGDLEVRGTGATKTRLGKR